MNVLIGVLIEQLYETGLTIQVLIWARGWTWELIPRIRPQLNQEWANNTSVIFLARHAGIIYRIPRPTYFAKLTFLCSLFPQVVISCLSSSLCQNARLSSAYCQIVNSTLLVLCCQLHIAKSSTRHCECYITNLPSWFVFQAAQMLFRPPQNNFKNSLPNA